MRVRIRNDAEYLVLHAHAGRRSEARLICALLSLTLSCSCRRFMTLITQYSTPERLDALNLNADADVTRQYGAFLARMFLGT